MTELEAEPAKRGCGQRVSEWRLLLGPGSSDCILAVAVWLASGLAATSITLTVNYTPQDPETARVPPVKHGGAAGSYPASRPRQRRRRDA